MITSENSNRNSHPLKLTRMTAFSILEIDSQIEWLINLPPDPLKGELEKEIENLKQQKIQIYEDSCNRF